VELLAALLLGIEDLDLGDAADRLFEFTTHRAMGHQHPLGGFLKARASES
jgi:hypothetical protein